LSPYFRNENGEAISVPERFRVTRNASGGRSPSCFVSIGLGANVSTCDGPPFMNRKITRFARGAKGGDRGASGVGGGARRGASARIAPSRPSTDARPTAPKPPPILRNSSRREQAGPIPLYCMTISPRPQEDSLVLIDKGKFVRAEQHLGVLVPLRPGIGPAAE